MHKCNTCQLSYEPQGMQSEGLCRGCAQQMAQQRQQQQSQQPNQAENDELRRLRAAAAAQPVQQAAPNPWQERMTHQQALTETAVLAQIPTAIESAKRLVRDEDPEFWDQHRATIEARVENAYPGNKVAQTDYNVWNAAKLFVEGELARLARREQLNAKLEEKPRGPAIRIPGNGPAQPSPAAAAAASQQKPELSRAELEVAGKMGLSGKEYQRGKDAYEAQAVGIREGKRPGDPLSGSPFDEFMTFSDAQKREKAAKGVAA